MPLGSTSPPIIVGMREEGRGAADRAAITHSYNGEKTALEVMWRSDSHHVEPITFVYPCLPRPGSAVECGLGMSGCRGTVVVATGVFWTKGLHSVVLPHCSRFADFQQLNAAQEDAPPQASAKLLDHR